MAQFDVFLNTHPSSKTTYPFLLDVQSPLLESLETRLVIPLMTKSTYGEKIINRLIPVIRVKGHEYLVLTPQMAAISKKHLGKQIENCSSDRNEIISSIDFLVTGF